jgi:hypothetical protein
MKVNKVNKSSCRLQVMASELEMCHLRRLHDAGTGAHPVAAMHVQVTFFVFE